MFELQLNISDMALLCWLIYSHPRGRFGYISHGWVSDILPLTRLCHLMVEEVGSSSIFIRFVGRFGKSARHSHPFLKQVCLWHESCSSYLNLVIKRRLSSLLQKESLILQQPNLLLWYNRVYAAISIWWSVRGKCKWRREERLLIRYGEMWYIEVWEFNICIVLIWCEK